MAAPYRLLQGTAADLLSSSANARARAHTDVKTNDYECSAMYQRCQKDVKEAVHQLTRALKFLPGGDDNQFKAFFSQVNIFKCHMRPLKKTSEHTEVNNNKNNIDSN